MTNPRSDDLSTSLRALVRWRGEHLKGDEKGEAQIFLDRLFRAFGHTGIREAGATLEERLKKRDMKGTAFADLMWKPRCLVEMKRARVDLKRHYRQAFDYWVQAVPDRPQYVVLCNFDEFWVYDFDIQLDEPVDRLKLTDLPSRWDALAFLLPEQQAPVFGNDLVSVTREAAAQVAGVFRSIHEGGVARIAAQRFVLQSVVSMFSEDIGLLPGHVFTKALDDCIDSSDPPGTAYDLLFGLFRSMNSPGVTPAGRYKGTQYFNGGLFANIEPLSISKVELLALREAATTNWSDVRPEIFGTLFEQSMAAGERHAYGAHFTSQADIVRIVGPTIVSPWRERIAEAQARGSGGIRALERVLADMYAYRVLDPACGSGNFLYVAYREMRRLEHEVLTAIAELRRSSDIAAQRSLAYVTPDHFYGIDRDPFAVEVAKVTMMLGKKLAADELEDDQSVLPLDDLKDTIVAGDALFQSWPKANAVIGNPPYLGRRKMVAELGATYVDRLKERYPKVGGVSDFVCYWFPLAHEHLPPGGRAGLVATKTIRETSSRQASLDYVVNEGGVIYDAVSSQPWSGDAVVHVSIVNWMKPAPAHPAPPVRTLWLNGGKLKLESAQIHASLSPEIDVASASQLTINRTPKTCFQGQTPGVTQGFTFDGKARDALLSADSSNGSYIFPFLGGDDLLHETDFDRYIIDLPHDDLLEAESEAPTLVEYLRERVLPIRQDAALKEALRNRDVLKNNPKAKVSRHHEKFLSSWWQLSWRRADLIEAIGGLDRYIGLTITASWQRPSVYEFIDSSVRPAASLQVFAFDDDYSFGILQSSLHRAWFEARCSRLKADLRYTPNTVYDSYPWPQAPTREDVEQIASIVKSLLELRASYFAKRLDLARQYDTLRRPGKSKLRTLHDELDATVRRAYGFSSDEDDLAQMLALNQDAAVDLSARGPGGAGLERARVSDRRLAIS